jgi:hypothetical protein
MKTEKEEIQSWIDNPGVKPLMGKVLITPPPSMDGKTTIGGLIMPGDVSGYPIGIVVGLAPDSKLREQGVVPGDAVSYHNGNCAKVVSGTTGKIFDIISDHDCFGIVSHSYDENGRIQFYASIGAVQDDRSASQLHADELADQAHGNLNDMDEHLYRKDIDSNLDPRDERAPWELD